MVLVLKTAVTGNRGAMATADANVEAATALGVSTVPAREALAAAAANVAAGQRLGFALGAVQKSVAAQAKSAVVVVTSPASTSKSEAIRSAATAVHDAGGGHVVGSGTAASAVGGAVHNAAAVHGGRP